MRGRVTVNSAEAYIACCLAGLGLIQIPAYDVKRHLDAGELVEVMPHHCAAPMPMTLLYPHRQHLSRRLQVFADWLAALFERAAACRGLTWCRVRTSARCPAPRPRVIACRCWRGARSSSSARAGSTLGWKNRRGCH